MPGIDAHNHFWKFDPVRDSWIDDSMQVIRRDFLPQDLEPLLKDAGMDGCIAVQADQSEAENDFLLALAAQNSFIKGVVGWVDLRADNIEERLEHYSRFPAMKGFRHILQGEKDRAMMLTPAFRRGISILQQYGFTYDILILADQVDYAYTLCREFPGQPFVIDHLAKPPIRSGAVDEWKKSIEPFRSLENVSCKVSGMVTEADWKHWRTEDFRPYLDCVTATFGMDRLLFGTDWPVCLLAGSYSRVVALAEAYYAGFSASEKEKFFGGNATKFYRINEYNGSSTQQ